MHRNESRDSHHLKANELKLKNSVLEIISRSHVRSLICHRRRRSTRRGYGLAGVPKLPTP